MFPCLQNGITTWQLKASHQHLFMKHGQLWPRQTNPPSKEPSGRFYSLNPISHPMVPAHLWPSHASHSHASSSCLHFEHFRQTPKPHEWHSNLRLNNKEKPCPQRAQIRRLSWRRFSSRAWVLRSPCGLQVMAAFRRERSSSTCLQIEKRKEQDYYLQVI